MYLFKLEFSLDICPGMGLQDHMMVLFLVFFFMVQKYLISARSVQKNTQPIAHPLKPKESTEKLVEIPIFYFKNKKKLSTHWELNYYIFSFTHVFRPVMSYPTL